MIIPTVILSLSFFLLFMCLSSTDNVTLIISGMAATFVIVLTSIYLEKQYLKEDAVKAGAAEWIQVIDDNGKCKNEFRWKTFEDEN